MKKFIGKLIIYLSPVLFILSVYLCKDPFKVLYHYDHYYEASDSSYYDLDADYISTQTLIQNFSKYHYDSYIFGSSRSGNYMTSEWAKHISSTACYHFDASWESLCGVERKFQFLKERHYPVKNALIIIDDELLGNIKNEGGHLRIKHPALSGQSMFKFQSEFLQDFIDKSFLYSYLDLLWSGHIKEYMVKNQTMNPVRFRYNTITNEYIHATEEDRMAQDSMQYYNSKKNILYDRDTQLHYSPPVIGAQQLAMLRNIKAVLADAADYRIVISPLYNQLKIDTTDLRQLNDIFGKQHVFDFSGINEYTQNKFNYYETSHYRIRVCTGVLNTIYQ